MCLKAKLARVVANTTHGRVTHANKAKEEQGKQRTAQPQEPPMNPSLRDGRKPEGNPIRPYSWDHYERPKQKINAWTLSLVKIHLCDEIAQAGAPVLEYSTGAGTAGPSTSIARPSFRAPVQGTGGACSAKPVASRASVGDECAVSPTPVKDQTPPSAREAIKRSRCSGITIPDVASELQLDGMQLRITPAAEILKPRRAVMYVQGPEVEPQLILARLERCNLSLDSRSWLVYGSEGVGFTATRIIVGLWAGSIEPLTALQMRPFYLLGRATGTSYQCMYESTCTTSSILPAASAGGLLTSSRDLRFQEGGSRACPFVSDRVEALPLRKLCLDGVVAAKITYKESEYQRTHVMCSTCLQFLHIKGVAVYHGLRCEIALYCVGDPKATHWASYCKALGGRVALLPLKNKYTVDAEIASEQLQKAIMDFYAESCPLRSPRRGTGSFAMRMDGSIHSDGTGSRVYICKLVFQAEISALAICVMRCMQGAMSHRRIRICTDSHASLRTLQSSRYTLRLVWEYHTRIQELAERNKEVVLYCIPGHCGLEGNEVANALARRGSEMDSGLCQKAKENHTAKNTVNFASNYKLENTFKANSNFAIDTSNADNIAYSISTLRWDGQQCATVPQ
ncbi:hypothetical protein TcasGA2_TC031802 [Tribolium castaneum]|uniref:Uncharacterized protein n=1 Tax=Tribolium castaneum TaxID=7070 RepID=A0A139WAF6_TRICA|nr:hypothetical protein TcasGA2_TC031802 [Tribolium castaneum]